MFHVVTLLFLLVAPQLINSITISPDVGLRNITNPIENQTINDLKLNNLTDRNRRLIPYMTFYIPQNEYPINQDYIPNPQQQHQQQQQQSEEQNTNPGHHQSQSSQNVQNQMITIYQSSPTPPPNRLQQQNHHQQQHQQHHYQESVIENHLHTKGGSGGGVSQPTEFIPLNLHNHRGQQIYQQILYQDHGRNQLPLIKLKGNIPFNQLQQHHHHQFPQQQQQHHTQQQPQHGIEGRIILKENNLSKTKQKQPTTVVHLYHPEQQQLTKTKLNSSPFTVFNKVPGHFTPIIYSNQGNNVNYNENSQQQYNNLINGDSTSSEINIGSIENDNIEQGHKHDEEHIYNIQQQQQHQFNKQQPLQYYQYHHHHNPQTQQLQQPEGNNNEQDVEQQSHPLQQHQKHVGIVSSTQRPHFQIVTEPPLQQLQPTQKHNYPPETIYNPKPELSLIGVQESSPNLTPQQKYVEYLQHQLRNKQQTRNQQQQQQQQHHHQQQQQQEKKPHEINNYHQQYDSEAYLINPSPLPSIAPPDNHINYQENHSPSSLQNHHRHHQYIYRPQSTKINNNQDKEIVYVQEDERNRPLISDTIQQTNQHNTQNHNYVEYINIPEEQHHQPHIPQQISSTISPPTSSSLIIPQQKDNNIYKPVIFVTTSATPILLTSVPSNYKHHHQQQQTQHLHPIIINPINSSEKPLLNNTNRYNNQHKRPIFIVKPKLYLSKSNQQQQQHIQPIRQHLTETTQLPAPILTSYRPNTSNNRNNNNNNRPYYNRYYHKTSTTSLPSTSSEIPLKLKPIVVTTLQPSLHLLKQNDDNDESQSIPVIPKYEKYQPIDIHNKPLKSSEERPQQHHHSETINNFPDIKSSSLAEILRKLQDSNHLPQTITPNNIDNSIKTLIKILNNLKESQTINENPPQHHDDDYRDYDDTPVDNPDPSHRGPNSGRPGIDYPALYEIPHTNFNCKEQRYKGFFGDPETNCQVWHYCDLNGGQASFLCPNGTIFSQVALTCDWWFNVKCSSTAQLYVLNERLYKYILPFTPKFPEDYSGPLVDKYLALKFKEMEEKMTREKLKGREKTEEDNENDGKIKETDEESKENNNIKNVNKTNDDDDEEDISKQIDERSNATENQEIKSINLEDVEENRGSVDTGITSYNTLSTSTENSLTLKPIIVSSTTIDPPIIYQSPTPFMLQSSTIRSDHNSKSNQHHHHHHRKQPKPRVSIESEQVELIEIKTDGSSGHLVPSNSEYSN